jgi:AcrR family transcriptional regulator
MPKIVDEQMREATRARVITVAAGEFARLGFDQANINVIAELAGMGKGTIYLYFENKRDLFLAMLRHIAQWQLAVIRTALAADGTLHQRLERLYRAFAHLSAEESDSFHVLMSALYGVNRSFQVEATKLVRDYVAVIALMLEQSQLRGEIRIHQIETTALMVLSLTESYVLSARVLGHSEQEIALQAREVADLVLHGIGTTSSQ